ncbi:fimbrial biogenesis outer membrane usher protein, partial [Salmonella enterica subsp. enterica serovar Typhimurium]
MYHSVSKNQFQLSVNQELGSGWGNLYLTGSTYSYWGHNGQRNEYQMGYSNFWKRLSYQVGFSQSRDNETQHRDDSVYMNFSLPLWEGAQSPLVSSTFNYNKGGKNNVQTSVSGVVGDDNQISYGVSANKQESGPSSYSVNGGYRSPFVNLMATAGNDSDNNRQMSIG